MQIVDHEGVVMTMTIGLRQMRVMQRKLIVAVKQAFGIGRGPDPGSKGDGGKGLAALDLSIEGVRYGKRFRSRFRS